MSTEIPEDLVSTELAAMRAENAKLKYRINVLDRVCHHRVVFLYLLALLCNIRSVDPASLVR